MLMLPHHTARVRVRPYPRATPKPGRRVPGISAEGSLRCRKVNASTSIAMAACKASPSRLRWISLTRRCRRHVTVAPAATLVYLYYDSWTARAYTARHGGIVNEKSSSWWILASCLPQIRVCSWPDQSIVRAAHGGASRDKC